MKKINRKGFSLIELLCVIAILGVLIGMSIAVISTTVNDSKKTSIAMQEKLLKNACESYIQDNRDKAPRVVGGSKKITLEVLKTEKYITEDIKKGKNESCMEHSYVLVHRVSSKRLTYLPVLYCGTEEVDESYMANPTINAVFIDGTNSTDNSLIFNNIDESRLYIEINGGTTKGGSGIEINNYQISISKKTSSNSESVECYNSGLISVGDKYKLEIDKKLNTYANFSDATSITVTVTTSNVVGGVSETSSTAQSK